MKPDLFLADFGHIANAPEGINRLREMIYNLAVTGALSEQRRSDGDGHSLLTEIVAKKQTLSDAGVYKRSPKLENLRDAFNENLPKIPSTWAWSRLVEVGEISPKNEAEDDAIASFASMSAISEMHSSAVASEDRPWGNIKNGYTHFANGDVVLAKITPCFENGKAAVMANLTNGVGAGTTELHVVRPIAGIIESGYIYVFLRSPYFKIVGEGHMTGTAGQKRLPTEYFATRPFPLPPLVEQKRIVAKVDELMVLCDQLDAQQRERERRFPLLSRTCHSRFAEAPTPTNLNRIFDETGTVSPADLRRSIVNIALQGRLVRQIEGDEPVEVLLARCKAEREQNERLSSGEGYVDSAVNGPMIPETWKWKELDDLLVAGPTNGISPKAVEHETTTRSLTLSATTSGRFKGEHSKFIELEVPADSDLWLRHGDVLVQRGNSMEYVGVAAVYLGEENQFVYPDLMMRCRFSSELDVRFIHLAMNQDIARDFLRARATGTSGSMPKINQTTLKSLPIPVPPLAEQRRIVAKVDELMALVDHLEAQQQERDRLAEAFAKACVASFTGTTQLERPEKK